MKNSEKPIITRRESTTYPGLFVKKYTRDVFYKNRWHESEELLESRGHVETSDGKIVINSFTKIFNYTENGTTIELDEVVSVVEKINGFMACATWVPEVNDVVISTTGSLDSDFVKMAKEMMPKVINILREEKLSRTFIFEIVHQDDPHIIPENVGVYLLGIRDIDCTEKYFSSEDFELELDETAAYLQVQRPYHFRALFKDVLEDVKKCRHEGYVVYGEESNTALKIKSPYYLALKALARCKDIEKLNKEYIDEEFYELVDHFLEMGERFTMNEQDRLTYIRDYYMQEGKYG